MTTRTATNARLTAMKPRPDDSDSNVGARLAAVHGDAGAVEQTCLLRAHERHQRGHLLDRAKPPQRHLRAHELRDGLRVRLLTPLPAPDLPEDRYWGDAVDGHASRRHLARKRGGEADLGCLGGVVSRGPTRLATPNRPDDHDAAPASVDHPGQHELGHAHAHADVAGEGGFEPGRARVGPRAAGAQTEGADEDGYRPDPELRCH